MKQWRSMSLYEKPKVKVGDLLDNELILSTVKNGFITDKSKLFDICLFNKKDYSFYHHDKRILLFRKEHHEIKVRLGDYVDCKTINTEQKTVVKISNDGKIFWTKDGQRYQIKQNHDGWYYASNR